MHWLKTKNWTLSSIILPVSSSTCIDQFIIHYTPSLVLNMHWLIRTPANTMMKLLLHPVTQYKFRIISKYEEMLEFLEPNQIPEWMGLSGQPNRLQTNSTVHPFLQIDPTTNRLKGGEELEWTENMIRSNIPIDQLPRWDLIWRYLEESGYVERYSNEKMEKLLWKRFKIKVVRKGQGGQEQEQLNKVQEVEVPSQAIDKAKPEPITSSGSANGNVKLSNSKGSSIRNQQVQVQVGNSGPDSSNIVPKSKDSISGTQSQKKKKSSQTNPDQSQTRSLSQTNSKSSVTAVVETVKKKSQSQQNLKSQSASQIQDSFEDANSDAELENSLNSSNIQGTGSIATANQVPVSKISAVPNQEENSQDMNQNQIQSHTQDVSSTSLNQNLNNVETKSNNSEPVTVTVISDAVTAVSSKSQAQKKQSLSERNKSQKEIESQNADAIVQSQSESKDQNANNGSEESILQQPQQYPSKQITNQPPSQPDSELDLLLQQQIQAIEKQQQKERDEEAAKQQRSKEREQRQLKKEQEKEAKKLKKEQKIKKEQEEMEINYGIVDNDYDGGFLNNQEMEEMRKALEKGTGQKFTVNDNDGLTINQNFNLSKSSQQKTGAKKLLGGISKIANKVTTGVSSVVSGSSGAQGSKIGQTTKLLNYDINSNSINFNQTDSNLESNNNINSNVPPVKKNNLGTTQTHAGDKYMPKMVTMTAKTITTAASQVKKDTNKDTSDTQTQGNGTALLSQLNRESSSKGSESNNLILSRDSEKGPTNSSQRSTSPRRTLEVKPAINVKPMIMGKMGSQGASKTMNLQSRERLQLTRL